MSDYTPSMEQIRSHYVFDQSDRWDPERGEAFDRALAAHDAEVRASVLAEQGEQEEPCGAEIWSWEIFRHQEVDPYWMRCHLLGPHDKHENSETGATWPRLPVEEPESTDGSER